MIPRRRTQHSMAGQIANLKDAQGQFDPAQQALLDTAMARVSSLDTEAGQNAYVAALAALFPAASESDPGLDASKAGFSDGRGYLARHPDATRRIRNDACGRGRRRGNHRRRCRTGCYGCGRGARLRSDWRRQTGRQHALESHDLLRDEGARWNGRANRSRAARSRGPPSETRAAGASRRAQLGGRLVTSLPKCIAGRLAGSHDFASAGRILALRTRSGGRCAADRRVSGA